jgi:ankyrin repeat domain-containing protein 50
VFCQLDALKRCLKASLVYETLEYLPRTLDETYARLFLAIDPAYQQDVKNALLWLAFSTRPLKLTELAEAIVINPEASPPFDPQGRFKDPQCVLQILSSLITVASMKDQRDMLDARGVVRPAIAVTLAHFSVVEYLISDRIQRGPAKHFAVAKSMSNLFIAECCLLYLLQYASSTLRTNSHEDLSSFPLLEYASVFWYQHANLAPPEHQKSLNSLVLKLLLSKSNLLIWLRLHTPIAREVGPFQGFEGERSVTIPLFYASDMGLVSTVKELLSDGFEPNETSGSYETPLHRAVMRGNEDVIILLLRYKANVNAKDIEGRTPLHSAMESTPPVVRLLLEHGAEVNAADNGGWTLLHLAAYHSHTEIVRILVDNGADVEVMIADTKQTPLHWAAWNEDGLLLDFLLQHGANINAQNKKGESALHYAARYHQSILPQLLIHGADVDMETEDGQTPLYWAASNMEIEAVQILIEAGSRTDIPLLISGESGLHPVFHLLLSAGVENAKSATITKNALQESARRGYGLCMGCQSLLSDWADHSGSALGGFEMDKEVELPGHSRKYGVEMVASQAPVPDFKWRGTRHFQIWLSTNADEERCDNANPLLTHEVGLAKSKRRYRRSYSRIPVLC